MAIQDAVKAAEDNINNHVSAHRDPAAYNVSVALLNIAQAIQRMESDVGDIERNVKRLRRELDDLSSKLRR
jgi:hypothetical protein